MIDIREYRPADWDAIAEVHDAARLQELAWSVGVEAFRSLAQTAEDEGLFDDRLWVAELDGAVVGFLAFADEELTWMYVHPAHQGRGVGTALVGHLFAHAEAAGVDRLWVAELDGAFVGFLAFADEELTWMYVHPAHQSRGVGTALVEHLFAHVEAAGVDRVELTVLDGNPARRLYERSGFTLVETKTGGLVGNEAFPATGHVMEWRRAPQPG